MTDHGLSDPDACESRKDIEISICEDVITLNEGNYWQKFSLNDFFVEIEQRCQDSLHNIFDEQKAKVNDEFERLAEICRPDPIGQTRKDYLWDLIEDNSRSDADPGL